jgi:hypothetical protein
LTPRSKEIRHIKTYEKFDSESAKQTKYNKEKDFLILRFYLCISRSNYSLVFVSIALQNPAFTPEIDEQTGSD